LTLVITLVIATELYIRAIPNTYSYQIDYLKSNAQNIEILVLGHSHLEGNRLSPDFFKAKLFNMATGGQGLAIDEFIVEKYIDDLKSVQCLILPLSYNSLIAPEAYGSDDKITYYKVYYGYRRNFFCKKDYELFARGIEKIKKHWNTIHEKKDNNNYQNDAKDISDLYNNMEIDTLNTYRLEHIVNLCANRDIKLVLVTTPTMIEYQKMLDITRLKMMYSEAEYLINRYDNVFYFDFSNDAICKDTIYFSDASHLNKKGAEYFSAKLAHDIDSLGLLK
jgi:hypothetical protein